METNNQNSFEKLKEPTYLKYLGLDALIAILVQNVSQSILVQVAAGPLAFEFSFNSASSNLKELIKYLIVNY